LTDARADFAKASVLGRHDARVLQVDLGQPDSSLRALYCGYEGLAIA
jgi:hypothetical protein